MSNAYSGIAVTTASPSVEAPSADVAPVKNTYGQILKSSAIIGGSSVVEIAVRIVRSKAIALLLGPAGVGLVGLYTSVLDLTHSIDGMGINSSGVRQIAEAVGSGETNRVARTATVLRRVSLLLGIVGALLLIVLCRYVSVWTFGSADSSVPVAFLSIAVLLSAISDGQGALLQGMRRIGDLARIRIITAVAGAALTLLLVYLYRDAAIVPSLVVVAGITLLVSWWYRRQIQIPSVSLSVAEVRSEAGDLLKLGFAFMASAVLTTGAAYLIRIVVRDGIGLDAAGLYQSAWSIGGLYVGFILQAMASDFYPRLTAVANNDSECNRLVNEQAEIGLLLAGPGVLATLTFAPLVLAVFYSARFAGAVEPLRWICLGMALRVIAWPMGYIILAKGSRNIFFWTEAAAAIVHVGLAFTLVKMFGLRGAAMAFFGLYIWHGLLVYWIVHRLTGFQWSTANRRTSMLFLPLFGFVFSCFVLLPSWPAVMIGSGAVVVSSLYSLRTLCRLIPVERIPRAARDILTLLGISPQTIGFPAAVLTDNSQA